MLLLLREFYVPDTLPSLGYRCNDLSPIGVYRRPSAGPKVAISAPPHYSISDVDRRVIGRAAIGRDIRHSAVVDHSQFLIDVVKSYSQNIGQAINWVLEVKQTIAAVLERLAF